MNEIIGIMWLSFVVLIAFVALYWFCADFDLVEQVLKDCCPVGEYELQVKQWDMQEQKFFCIKQGTWDEVQTEYKQMIQQGHNSSTCRVVQVLRGVQK